MNSFIPNNHSSKFFFIMGLVLLFVTWHIASIFFIELVLPSPKQTFTAIYKMFLNGELIYHLRISLIRVMFGFFLGTFIAIIIGILAGRFSFLYEMLRPLQAFLIGSPPIAIVVIAMIWFGTSHFVSIFVVSVLIFPTVYIHTADGYRQLNRQLFEMAQVYRRSLISVLINIVFPGLFLPIFTSVSLAMGSAFRIGIMAELLSASEGIGSSLGLARSNLDTAKVFAWLFISTLLVIVFDYFFIRPIRRNLIKKLHLE